MELEFDSIGPAQLPALLQGASLEAVYNFGGILDVAWRVLLVQRI